MEKGFVMGCIVVAVLIAGFFPCLYWIAASYVVDNVWQIRGLEGFAIKVVVFALIAGLISALSRIGQKAES